MSRTVRRKGVQVPDWVLGDSVRISGTYMWVRLYNDPKSKEGKRRINRARSDAGYQWHNRRGPGWFINEFSQAPYRRRARDELNKFLKNPDYEVVLEDRPKREYWD